jgi:hypothetical protein
VVDAFLSPGSAVTSNSALTLFKGKVAEKGSSSSSSSSVKESKSEAQAAAAAETKAEVVESTIYDHAGTFVAYVLMSLAGLSVLTVSVFCTRARARPVLKSNPAVSVQSEDENEVFMFHDSSTRVVVRKGANPYGSCESDVLLCTNI